jgi:hypothetical protein
MEAIQVWWPRSFLNRPFRYAAQFFLLLTTSALLFLFWQVPADTLDNSSGGIIGYELGQSLEQLLTVYGAAFFLLVLWVGSVYLGIWCEMEQDLEQSQGNACLSARSVLP